MKYKQFIFSTLLLLGICLTGIRAQNEQNITNQNAYYFNQSLPCDSAVIFAPGILSLLDRLESKIVFSPDGKECYIEVVEIKDNKASYKTYYTQYVNNKWTEQLVVPFSKNNDVNSPFLSAEGKRLYFVSNGDIWMVERKPEGWGEPQILPSPINSDSYEGSYTETVDGAVYFSSKRSGGFGGLDNWRINRLADQSLQAENLGPILNSSYFDYSPFIAPDGSYLIFGSYRAQGDGLLYISFNNGINEWTDPLNMNSCGAKVNNTTAHHSNPSLSPDGKFLFFRRHEADTAVMNVYWVSTGIIEKLKMKAFQKVKLTEELFKAVDTGDLNKVQALIEADPTLIETKDSNGSTPLTRACLNTKTMQRQLNIAKFLIEKSANVNRKGIFDMTPLLLASVGFGPDFDLIKVLIENGAEINVMGTNGITPIHWAAKYNNLKVARLLIDNGADINFYDRFKGPVQTSSISGTVLQVAINYSTNIEMVKFAIDNGAKVNRTDSQGNTELHLATFKGSVELVKLLLDCNIDVNAVNKYNRTALYYAAKRGYKSVAETLLAAGADKNTIAETNYGKAPQLTETLKEGEAYLWDLGFRVAVKTKENLIIFTIGGKIDESPEAGLANGNLNPKELAGQKITTFLRHRDYWQARAEDFEQLAKLKPGIELVSSSKLDFSKEENQDIPSYRLAAPNESFSVNGIQVHTIPALAGGMGYLVEADGLKIFHAGLHISDDKPEHIEKYRKEIDFLKPYGSIDFVFLTVHSHSNNVSTGYEQYLYLIDKLRPKAIYLWGANVPEQYRTCAEFLKIRNIPIYFPETNQADGERYHYLQEKIQK